MSPRPVGPPAALLPAAATAAATFVLFAATVCPTVPFGDGGELIAAADCLGVAHPPGYPLYTLLGWIALRLSPGEPALGMNLLSALFGALTCGAVAWIVARVAGSPLAAVCAGLALGASSTFWWVSTVAEVYTLHLFLMAVVLGAALVAGQTRDGPTGERALVTAGAALGLGLAHHPTIVLVLPAAVALAAVPRALRGIRARAFVLAAALAIGLPVALDLTLMERARLDPASNWGRPDTLAALIPHVTAAAYRHLDLGWAGLLRAPGWRRLGSLLWSELTPVALPLAILGLLAIPSSGGVRPAGRFRLAVALLVGGAAAFGLRYATEDVEVFFLPVFLGLALAGGLGIAWLGRSGGAVRRWVALTAGLVMAATPLLAHFPARNLRSFTAAAEYGRDVLATVPPGGALFVEVDDAFVLLYLHQVLGERPDVTIYDRTGNLFRDLLRDLELRRAPGESPLYYRVRVEQSFVAREWSRTPPREVLYLGWPGYELPPGFRLEPVGLLYRACPVREPMRDPAPVWAGYHEDSVREQALRTGDGFSLAVAATYPLARGERELFVGRRAEADALLAEASRLAEGTSGVHNYIGTLYGRIGDYPRAIEAFRRALEIKPMSVRAWNNLALAYELAGDAQASERAWRRSLELVPGQQEAEQSLRRLGGRHPGAAGRGR